MDANCAARSRARSKPRANRTPTSLIALPSASDNALRFVIEQPLLGRNRPFSSLTSLASSNLRVRHGLFPLRRPGRPLVSYEPPARARPASPRRCSAFSSLAIMVDIFSSRMRFSRAAISSFCCQDVLATVGEPPWSVRFRCASSSALNRSFSTTSRRGDFDCEAVCSAPTRSSASPVYSSLPAVPRAACRSASATHLFPCGSPGKLFSGASRRCARPFKSFRACIRRPPPAATHRSCAAFQQRVSFSIRRALFG